MSTTTSSAEPAKLQTYSNIACSLDAEISADAGRLSSALASFESRCREPGFAVNASYAASDMSRFANDARPTDEWVARVGEGFLAADSGSLVTAFPTTYGSGPLEIGPTSYVSDYGQLGYPIWQAISHRPIPAGQYVDDALRTGLSRADETWGWVDGALTTGSIFTIGFGMAGTKAPDAFHTYWRVHGSWDLKSQLGWARGLTKFTPSIGNTAKLSWAASKANLADSFNFKGWTGKLNYAGYAISLGVNAFENYDDYRGDPSKIVIGTTVDTAIDIAGGAGGRLAGAFIGGVIGTAIGGPVGTAIGVQVGGFVGQWAGQEGARFVREHTQIDEWMTDNLEEAYEGGKESLESAFDSVANQVADLFA